MQVAMRVRVGMIVMMVFGAVCVNVHLLNSISSDVASN